MESARVLTVPNLISFARLLGVPLFLYLFLATHAWGWAILVLAIGGLSDWVDGFAARKLHQVSRLGELLDPAADRLYILATIFAFTAKGVLPWAFTIALLVLRRHGYGPPPVHYVGKTGTFVLLAAFPILLLAAAVPATEAIAGPIGWGAAWWGLGLYWAAAVLYLAQAGRLLRADRAATGARTVS